MDFADIYEGRSGICLALLHVLCQYAEDRGI